MNETTSDGRALRSCLAQPPPGVTCSGWELRRKPRCNRNEGHDGPHQERDRVTFGVRAEWTDDA